MKWKDHGPYQEICLQRPLSPFMLCGTCGSELQPEPNPSHSILKLALPLGFTTLWCRWKLGFTYRLISVICPRGQREYAKKLHNLGERVNKYTAEVLSQSEEHLMSWIKLGFTFSGERRPTNTKAIDGTSDGWFKEILMPHKCLWADLMFSVSVNGIRDLWSASKCWYESLEWFSSNWEQLILDERVVAILDIKWIVSYIEHII